MDSTRTAEGEVAVDSGNDETIRPDSPSPVTPTDGLDAVCFTAGPPAAVVGAGTIHAYLAARRPPPRVVAGISLGALNAAVMTHVYRERAGVKSEGKTKERFEADQDACTWTTYRQYLQFLTDRPFDVIWQGIPDPSDFFADLIPIRDQTVPKELTADETEARRQLYLKVKLGRWLSRLPINVRLIASALVNYVRLKERYPWWQRAASGLKILSNLAWLIWLLAFRVCRSPQFVWEHLFQVRVESDTPREGRSRIEAFLALVWSGLGWVNLFSIWLWWVLIGVVLTDTLVLKQETIRWQTGLGLFAVIAAVVGLAFLVPTVRSDYQRWKIRLGKRRKPQEWAYCALAFVGRLLGEPEPKSLLRVWLVIYSFVNVAFLGRVVFRLFQDFRVSAPVESLDLYQFIAITWWSIGFVFALLVMLKEGRAWLIEERFMPRAPRPLFGWLPFAGCVLNVVSLAAVAVMTSVFFGTNDWSTQARGRLGHGFWALLDLAAAFAIPLLICLSLWPIWNVVRARLRGTRGKQKTVRLGLSLALGLIGLGLAIYVQDLRLNAFHSELEKMGNSVDRDKGAWLIFEAAAHGVMITWFALIAVATQPPLRQWALERVLLKLGIRNSLVSDLYLNTQLQRLFGPSKKSVNGDVRTVGTGKPGVYPDAVLVASPLQPLKSGRGTKHVVDQLWADPDTGLVDAVRCALGVPPIFAPVRLFDEDQKHWLRSDILTHPENSSYLKSGIVMVDGGVVRHNPLPSLFGFLRGHAKIAEAIAKANTAATPAIHVVYGVPTEPLSKSADAAISNNIVDVGLDSLRLSQRRDTQQEVAQTNFIAELQTHLAPHGDKDRTAGKTYPIFADEISPETDITFDNRLAPKPEEVLKSVAAGCRRSLERLYQIPLREHGGDADIQCSTFFGARKPAVASERGPGLPEVCEQCPGTLRRTASPDSGNPLKDSLGQPAALVAQHGQLSGEQPRLIFVASGGVFRGAFHVGMLGAFKATGAKPDLIVGASVGTLMGGALAKMFANPNEDTLGHIVSVFLRVDERIALTRRLKTVARELGIRGKGIRLSPRDVRKMIVAGGREDAGFAATGAPPALIDAISDLLLIPHGATRRIAAQFVGGDITGATKSLINCLRRHTIGRLDIETAVIDASLLERVAVILLSSGLGGGLERQPFQRAGIAFYGTTTNLRTQSALLLGGNGTDLYPGAPYDFVQAGLASSAFPAVFAPRPESLVFPGTGKANVLFADGGMFDNLPFQPALTILASGQVGHRATDGRDLTAGQLLERRLKTPDLIVAGALDPQPDTDENDVGSLDSLGPVKRRAATMQNNVKIRSFALAADRVNSQLTRLAAEAPGWLQQKAPHFVDRVVNAGVLAVFPHSAEHLNGTFSFCASTGLSTKRVRKSIADGCYQTLAGFAMQQEEIAKADTAGQASPSLTARAVAGLTKQGKIKQLIAIPYTQSAGRDVCPFFQLVDDSDKPAPLTCPFAERTEGREDEARIRRVFMTCKTDPSRPLSDRSIPRDGIVDGRDDHEPAGVSHSAVTL